MSVQPIQDLENLFDVNGIDWAKAERELNLRRLTKYEEAFRRDRATLDPAIKALRVFREELWPQGFDLAVIKAPAPKDGSSADRTRKFCAVVVVGPRRELKSVIDRVRARFDKNQIMSSDNPPMFGETIPQAGKGVYILTTNLINWPNDEGETDSAPPTVDLCLKQLKEHILAYMVLQKTVTSDAATPSASNGVSSRLRILWARVSQIWSCGLLDLR